MLQNSCNGTYWKLLRFHGCPRFLRKNNRTAPNTAAKAAIEVAIVNVDGKDIGFTDGGLAAFEFNAMMFLN